jgi:hypothetical protein
MPAKGIFFNNSLSINSLVSCSITLFFGFRTNCLEQLLHLKFWLPLWMNPFLTTRVELQRGQEIILFDMMILLGATYPYILTYSGLPKLLNVFLLLIHPYILTYSGLPKLLNVFLLLIQLFSKSL